MKKGKYSRFDEQNLLVAKRPIDYILAVVISIFTLIVFMVSLDNNITNWDDNKYINDNQLISPFEKNTIKKIFFSDSKEDMYFMGNYHPLTMLSLNYDFSKSEKLSNGNVSPKRFIWVNIILHSISVVLVFLICMQLFKNKLFWYVITILFAINTLHVESVTWISERKDVLYAMFYFCSLLFYILFKKKNNWAFYALSFVLFVLSCFSKGQAVSLAITFFAVDYFLTNDYLKIKTHFNKIPFLIVALVFGIISMKAQSYHFALSETDVYPVYQRVAIASWGFFQYLIRLLVPIRLTNLYAYPDIINLTIPFYFWLAIPIFVSSFYFIFKYYKTHKTFCFGLLFFLINIILLLQFLPVGSAMYADRYSYIPSIGFNVLFCLLIDYLIKNYQKYKMLIYCLLGLYVGFLTYLTVERQKVWKDSISLWSDCLEKSPESLMGWNNLGTEYNSLADSLFSNDFNAYKNYKDKSIECFTKALEYKPDYDNAFYNRALAKKDLWNKTNDTSYLFDAYRDNCKALTFNLNFANCFQNRAINLDDIASLYQESNIDTCLYYQNLAINDLLRSIDLDSTLTNSYLNLGALYGKTNKFDKAIECFEKYISKTGEDASVLSNLGLAYNGTKEYQKALETYQRALRIDSLRESVYFNRSITYNILNQKENAKKDLTKVLELNPNNIQAKKWLDMLK